MINFDLIEPEVGYKRAELVDILGMNRRAIDKLFNEQYFPYKTILKTKFVLGKDLLEYLNKPKPTRVVKNRINTLII